MEGAGSAGPEIRFDVYSRDLRPARLATHRVAATHFSSLGMELAAELGIAEPFQMCVAVLDQRHPLAVEVEQDDDFEVLETPELLLPHDFSIESVGPTRLIRDAPAGWLAAVFEPRAYQEFIAAASAPNEVERGWLGDIRVVLDQGVVHAVIEDLVEVPTIEAGKYFLRTSAQQVYELHQAHPRGAAYAHLHPREVEIDESGVARPLGPFPSGPDVMRAISHDAVLPPSLPVVCPIAMSEFRPTHEKEEISAAGFIDNLLSPIPLKIRC
jgi:hypothetical protein